jgi:solute carrier family 8 (sodium/calcium exchanger)
MPFEKLQDVVNSRQMKRDIPKLSPGQQTSSLEGYHSVINHFTPKIIGFSYHRMLCRYLSKHYCTNLDNPIG